MGQQSMVFHNLIHNRFSSVTEVRLTIIYQLDMMKSEKVIYRHSEKLYNLVNHLKGFIALQDMSMLKLAKPVHLSLSFLPIDSIHQL